MTSNHDETSWNKADYGSFSGRVHASFSVFTQPMSDGVPLIYSGQEGPGQLAIRFFDKDPLAFGKYKRATFYAMRLALRKRNPALACDASFRKVKAGNEQAMYA